VRVAAAAGCRTVVLTNAAGGIREGLSVGQPVLISDHLNLTARSPLVGARFVDLVDLYSARLRELVRGVDPTLEEGVYAALPGPHYETGAEVRMLRGLGADLVGMSTALEAIAARAEGMEVLAVSLVTNLAAGMTGEPLDHAEVLAAGGLRRPRRECWPVVSQRERPPRRASGRVADRRRRSRRGSPTGDPDRAAGAARRRATTRAARPLRRSAALRHRRPARPLRGGPTA
jgi:hypothetical protein